MCYFLFLFIHKSVINARYLVENQTCDARLVVSKSASSRGGVMVKKKKKAAKKVAKKKVAKKKVAKKKVVKKKKAAKKGKKAFGGYTVNFRGCNHTLEQILGRTAIAPSQMTKKLWAYVKKHRLNTR
jgi:chromatin remodeling complex protein RSC6